MRKIVLFLILVLTAWELQAQTIRRVNNTPGLSDPSVFTTVQAAVNAANAGDTIYIEPTSVNSGKYDNVVLEKPLTIIGTGHNLNLTPNTIYDKRQVSMNIIQFNNGSSGSTLIGLTITDVCRIYDENITVSRCQLNHIVLDISPNYINGKRSFGNRAIITNNRIYNGDLEGHRAFGVIIANNIFSSSYYQPLKDLTGAVIVNNVINSTQYDTPRLVNIDNSTVFGNIFDARTRGVNFKVFDNTSHSTSFSYNLCIEVDCLPADGNNVNGADPALIFKILNPWTANPWNDDNVNLNASSPAKTAGPGGTPIGVFSGFRPFVLSGVPNVPATTLLLNSGSGDSSTPLDVTISVRSKN